MAARPKRLAARPSFSGCSTPSESLESMPCDGLSPEERRLLGGIAEMTRIRPVCPGHRTALGHRTAVAASPGRADMTFVVLSGLLAASLVAGAARLAFAGFTEQAQFGAGNTLSVAWGDANGDGRPDLAVANLDIGNWLYTNNGDGTFTGAVTFGSYSTFAIVWGGIENNGDLDVRVGE